MPNWLLPEYIADVLPAEARKMEDLRRVVLDNFRLYGYELVITPMLEYLESLLTGAGQDTELNTFKLIDQLSGRTMGIRADMTTQVARIDAHLLNRRSITRLCYSGSVLHTRPAGLQATREPLQIGAEIFGHAGLEADAEIQDLALASLKVAGVSGVCLDLCHVGVLKALIAEDAEARKYEADLFSLLEAKDMPSLTDLTVGFDSITRNSLLALPSLYGDSNVIARAREILPSYPGITKALDEIEFLSRTADCDSVTIDLADLHGYHYHSGVMFAAYVPGLPNAVARGGRYDHVGEAFGRARPATGFSMDLREISRILPPATPRGAIFAPWGNDAALCSKIRDLRCSGEIVIQGLSDDDHLQDEFEFDRQLVREEAGNGNWKLKNIGKQ